MNWESILYPSGPAVYRADRDLDGPTYESFDKAAAASSCEILQLVPEGHSFRIPDGPLRGYARVAHLLRFSWSRVQRPPNADWSIVDGLVLEHEPRTLNINHPRHRTRYRTESRHKSGRRLYVQSFS